MAHQSSKLRASITSFSPEAHHEIPDEHTDTLPSDVQPPGVDEEPEYESLEQALLGE